VTESNTTSAADGDKRVKRRLLMGRHFLSPLPGHCHCAFPSVAHCIRPELGDHVPSGQLNWEEQLLRSWGVSILYPLLLLSHHPRPLVLWQEGWPSCQNNKVDILVLPDWLWDLANRSENISRSFFQMNVMKSAS
jgi:hypothetical protein